jgi:DNA polymerase-3 subunit delta'
LVSEIAPKEKIEPTTRPDAVKWLEAYIKNENIPHALLFSGIEGIGKHSAAVDFAMACNCMANDQIPSATPCRRCRSCRKIQSGNHPDIILIEPSGQFIQIDQIRMLRHSFSMKPLEARWRMAIIKEAQAMNPAASNALLKILEEPPEQSVLILVARQKSDLLPTVVSRCKLIRFSPVSRDLLSAFLIEKKGIAAEDAMVMASMAGGSYHKAERLRQSGWVKRRNWLITAIGMQKPGQTNVRSLGQILLLAEEIAGRKEYIDDSLEILQSWFRDMIVSKYDPTQILNQDWCDDIKAVSGRYTIAALLDKIGAVEEARKAILRNAQPRLVLENLLIQLAG